MSINSDNLYLLNSLLDYLKTRPDDIYEELLNKVKKSGVSEDYAYASLLNSFLGLDDEFIDRYLVFMLKKEKMDLYLNNPFYQVMQFEQLSINNLKLDYKYIEAYELFMQDEIDEYFDGRLFAQIGYSIDYLKCLTLFEKNKIIDSFSPLLVNASIIPLEKVSGKVAIFGLGIGYFAYMAHLKEDVSSIIIYESNKDLISLFKKHMLDKFVNKDKIKIVNEDAYSFLKKKNNKLNANYVYINVWKNLEDGIKEYSRFKTLEELWPKVKFLYYLEQSINLYPKEENNENN